MAARPTSSEDILVKALLQIEDLQETVQQLGEARALPQKFPRGVTLGGYLAQARINKKMTLDEVAKAARASKSFVWAYENNKNPVPTVAAMLKLSKALTVPFDVLCHLAAKV